MAFTLPHLFFVIFFIAIFLDSTVSKVSLSIDGLNLTVRNEFFDMKFIDGLGGELTINGSRNLANRAFIDFISTDGAQEEIGSFQPTILEVLSQSDDFVHFVFKNEIVTEQTLRIEMHCIVASSISGMYQYVVVRNTVPQTISKDEIRMRFDLRSEILDTINNGKIQMIPPTPEECNVPVQDATCLLPDGTYYSKYDLAGYVREANYYGVLGNGYGTWIIHASHEYFSGGPLKQDLLTHQYAELFVYLTGSHFGTPHLHMAPGFEKMYGPWLVYFSQGTNEEMIEDVERQVEEEVAKWPYTFINDTRYYPVSRGIVRGTVKGVKAMVVLSPPNEDYDLQVQGYSYNTETVNGAFILDNVRPGYYMLSVYPLKGASVGTLLQKKLTVSANRTIDAGAFEIKEPSNTIWQIGEVDHRASEFKYSNKTRNYRWHLEPPANLTFDIGSSLAENDWYYAQTKKGTWKIQFEDSNNGKGRNLLISVAGCTYTTIIMEDQPKLNVYLNGKFLTSLDSYENDKSIYRGALQSGNFHHAKIHIDSKLVKNGTNIVSFELAQGMFMYDCIVYSSP